MDNSDVKRQYERWVYPEPIPDLNEWRNSGGIQLTDPSFCFPIFFPERGVSNLNILVAGCGTHQSACLAFCNPGSKFTAIDISNNSLEHTRRLKEKHNLQNLEVRELSLLSVAELGQSFDLIVSTGVLHHLPDPVAGCRALADVLEPDGVMTLMLYGSSLRAGVYMLQRAFRAAKFDQSEEDVRLLKDCLNAVPTDHSIRAYTKSSVDMKFDAGIVDTFLHPQDKAYSIGEIQQFIDQSGLKFHSWLDNGHYAYQNHLAPDFPAFERIKKLPSLARAEFVDSFLQLSGTHRFNVCHKSKTGHEISFDGSEHLTYIPIHRPPISVLQTADASKGINAKMRRGGFEYEVGGAVTIFLEEIDGERTIAEIVKRISARASNSSRKEVRKVAKFVYEDYWERGHIMFRKGAKRK